MYSQQKIIILNGIKDPIVFDLNKFLSCAANIKTKKGESPKLKT
jgi:hypothetical protein